MPGPALPRRRRHHRRFAPAAVLGTAVVAAGTGLVLVNTGEPEPESATSAPPSANAHNGKDAAAPPSGEGSEPPVLLRSETSEVTAGSGDLAVVEGKTDPSGSGPYTDYLVEVEEGLPGNAGDFADAVETILSDERSWGGNRGEDQLRRVDSEPADVRVALAAPDTVDELCAPLQTDGEVSCAQDGRAIINQNRWVSGVEHFNGDLETYRTYVINHEVGHTLGYGHVDCPGDGERAPVMQQQTLSLDGCDPNGWVNPDAD